MRLVLASNNAKKLSELLVLLADLGDTGVALVSQAELGIEEADEPFDTFIENALAKARHAALASQGPALADDSGLCVTALGGDPGVASAHFAGLEANGAAGGVAGGADLPPATLAREERRRRQDQANNTLLLQRLDGQAQRTAFFISTLVAVRHATDPQPLVAVGRWPGQILHAPRGNAGFGYDPLMFIPELGLSVAELSLEQKNQHSHRARAFLQMRALLREVWGL